MTLFLNPSRRQTLLGLSAEAPWFDRFCLLGSASADSRTGQHQLTGNLWQSGVGTQSIAPLHIHLEPVRLILLAKQSRFVISFNPDNIPENYPHRGSLIPSSRCRLFLNLATWLRAGPTFDVADLGCVSCLVAPSLLPSSWINRWARHLTRPCHKQLERLDSAALQLALS